VVFLDQGAEHPHHLVAAALRADGDDIGIVQHHGTQPVPGTQYPPGRQCRRLGGRDRLHVHLAAEEHALALVHDHPDRPVALLGIDAHVRLSRAGGSPPVDIADIVARKISTQFLEVEAAPAPAQPRRMPSVQHAVHGLARQEAETLGLELQANQLVQISVDPRVRSRLLAPGSYPRVLHARLSVTQDLGQRVPD
jgi:hypothetical protein